MNVSVIIPVFKPHVGQLMQCIESVIDDAYEVIIALDGNAFLPKTKLNSRIKVLPHSTSWLGYGANIDRAIQISACENLLLINDDAYIKSKDAIELFNKTISIDNTAVAGCRAWFPDNTIYHGGMRRVNGPFFEHIDYQEKVPTITHVQNMEAVNFATVMLKKQAYHDIGGFDKKLFCYYEDLDLCLRLIFSGYKVVYNPHIETVHVGHRSTGWLLRSIMILKSRWYYARKWWWIKGTEQLTTKDYFDRMVEL